MKLNKPLALVKAQFKRALGHFNETKLIKQRRW